MTWDELRDRLIGVGRAHETTSGLLRIDCPAKGGGKPVPVLVRRVTALGNEWLHLFAVVGPTSALGLERLLSAGAGLAFAEVGLDGPNVVVREKVLLAAISPESLDRMVVALAGQALALRAGLPSPAAHPYAELFAS